MARGIPRPFGSIRKDLQFRRLEPKFSSPSSSLQSRRNSSTHNFENLGCVEAKHIVRKIRRCRVALKADLVRKPRRIEDLVGGIVARRLYGRTGRPAKSECLYKAVFDGLFSPIRKAEQQIAARKLQLDALAVTNRKSE